MPFVVRPGDSVSVTIEEQSANNWTIDFTNNTTGKTYHTTKRYTSSHSSAEWVVEAPSSGSGILPLDNFGNVSFTDASATRDGQSVNLSQMHAQPITMLGNGGQKLAVPSSIGGDGGSFSVARTELPSTSIGVARGSGSGAGQGTGVARGSGSGQTARPGASCWPGHRLAVRQAAQLGLRLGLGLRLPVTRPSRIKSLKSPLGSPPGGDFTRDASQRLGSPRAGREHPPH